MLRSDDLRTRSGFDAGQDPADAESRLISEAADDVARAREASPNRPDGRETSPEGKDAPAEEGRKERTADDAKDEAAESDNRTRLQKLRDFVGRHPRAVAIGAIVLVAAIVAGALWYLHARHFETTDDAFIDARQFSIAPKVSGYVSQVFVTDNQHIDADAPIARIDTRDYDAAVDQAKAQVQAGEAAVQSAAAQIEAQRSQIGEAQAQVRQTEAALTFAREESQRAQELVQRGAGTAQRAQQTASELTQAQANSARAQAAVTAATGQIAVLEAQRKSAEANLVQARAQLEQARLNLSYTSMAAPQPGRIVRLTAAKGQLAQAGQALSMFVPDEMWVTANFKETQLADMRPGQKVEMTIDAYPGRTFEGHVDSVQPGSGTAFSLLPAQNATGNYVKVVQRVPVKLVFDNLPSNVTIGPGMSVAPQVRVR